MFWSFYLQLLDKFFEHFTATY